MKIKNPETGEVIVVPQGMEDDVRNAIESGNDPMEVMQMKYGGIHINPANKGKFNATKKATGKTTEELTHSKNPLTRKRAVFAQNAKRFKHQDGGQAMEQQDQMQQLIQIAEQALAQGASPEEVAQMLVQKGVPEQVVQQVIQYAIQDLEQTQGQNPQEEVQEQGQQQNPQEEQAEMRYGGYMQGGGKSGKLTPEEIKWLATSLRGDQDPDYLSHYPDNSLPGLDPNRVKYLQDDQKAQLREYMKGTDIITDVVQGFTPNIPFFNPKPSGGVLENKGMPSQQRFIQKGYGGNGLSKEATMALQNPNIRSQPYINGAYETFMKTGDTNALNDYNAYTEANKYLLQRDSVQNANNTDYYPYGNAPQQRFIQKENGGMSMYGNGGGIDNPGFRALPAYVQQDIINNMRTGGKFLRKAENGIYDDNQPYTPEDEISTNSGMTNYDWKAYDPNKSGYDWNSSPNQFSNPSLIGITGSVNRPIVSNRSQPNLNPNVSSSILPSSRRPFDIGLKDNSFNDRYNSENILSGQSNLLGNQQTTTPSGNTKLSSFDKYNKGLSNITGGNSYFGRGISHLGQATFDFTKGGLEMAGANISNRNALGDEANNLRSAMRNDYKKVGKRPTDGNAIIGKYGGRMMQDGGATYADKMKVSKDSPEADFIAEKGEYIVNNGVASKLETGGSHASGNDTAISLDKSSNPSYVLSDTPRLKQLQFGGKRVSPSKYAEMATVEALGKTPDQILKAYTAFTKRAGTEGKVFGDRISDATNQLLAQKYQKDLATVKQIADQAYHKQEQLKHAMGMDNDLDHAQQVNGIQMSQYGGMQDDVHMNYFNAPAVQYGGSPQLFSDPSELGYNTTQMAYGGLHKMQNAGNANTTATAAAAPTSNYPTYGGGKYPSGLNTPGPIKSTNEFRGGTPEQYTKEWGDSGLDLSGFKTAKEVQEATYKELLKIPEGRDRIREMWKYGNTALGIKKGIGKGLSFDNLSDEDLLKLLPAYTDDMLGVRSLTPVKKQPTDITTPKPEAKESKPPVVESQEVDKKPFEYTPAEEKDTYDIPPVNFYIPQPYGRNPIGLQLAQAQTIRPAKLNIQPELNEYTRGMRGALRGTQGNTSVNVAQQMQGLNNLYGAQNRLFGQKYNFDEQSRMGAEQFNAQAIMNTDAANLQRIAAEQDAIARREGVLDTQRRTDFQAGIENADKQNAYNLSKKYIESTFAPYLNNQGKLNFTYDPITAEKNTKEKSYTASELNKMTPEQRKALGLKFGGSVKKIKLKLRK